MTNENPTLSDQPDSSRFARNVGLALIGISLAIWFYLLYIDYSRTTRSFVWVSWIGMIPAVGGLGWYARSMRHSRAWAVMGLLPIVGPAIVLGVFALEEWLTRRGASKFVRNIPAMLGILVFLGCFMAIIVTALWEVTRAITKTRQAEAPSNLASIYVMEKEFYEKRGRYGTFKEIGWVFGGANSLYTYRIDGSGRPGTVIPAGKGEVTPDNTIVPAGISPDGQSFTATATANLDADPTIDQWHVDDRKQQGSLHPDTNDVDN